MKHASSDFLIIGCGIIGMMTAKLLAEAGYSVTLTDRRQPAQESSWAGGGILSPLYPWRYPDSINQLARWGHQHYPQLAAHLQASTNIDSEVYTTGLLIPETQEIEAATHWAKQYHYTLKRLNTAEITQCEPLLQGTHAEAIWLPDIAHVRNPRLVKALLKHLTQLGVSLLPQTEVIELSIEKNHVTSVKTPQNRLYADEFIVTAGAWSAKLLQAILPNLPVFPMKGQMLLFKTAPGKIKRMVLHNGRYIIPRKDGHTLFGSTLERVGFDKTPTPEAMDSLKHSAYALMPALKTAPIVKHWAGLRPASPDGIPSIGRHPTLNNLSVNTGHFRNGVILGAASAQLMTNILLQQDPILDPRPYALPPPGNHSQE